MPSPPLPELPIHVRRQEEPSVSRPIERSPELGVFPNEMGTPVALPTLRVVTNDVCVALDCFFVHQEGAHAHQWLRSLDPGTGRLLSRSNRSWLLALRLRVGCRRRAVPIVPIVLGTGCVRSTHHRWRYRVFCLRWKSWSARSALVR